MGKKCPPGVFCIENVTIIFLFIVLLVVLFIVYSQMNSRKPERDVIIKEKINEKGLFSLPSYSFSNVQEDVLLNPYQAPLRDNRFFPNFGNKPPGIPINVQTQGVDTSYRQVGILTRIAGPEMILPLMGRPLYSNRDKWNFYTMTDKNNMIKLPISNKGKSCTSEYGCDNLYSGDTVYVEGYNDAFNVTVYDNNVMRYIPFL